MSDSEKPSSGVEESSSGVAESSSGVAESSSGVAESSSGVEESSSGVEESNSNDDLDNLLDSALGDFEKPLPKVTTEKLSASNAAAGSVAQNSSDAGGEWDNKDFKKVHDAVQTFLNEDPDFRAGLEQLTGNAATAEFSSSLEEAMKAIASNAQSLPEPNVAELEKLFGTFGLADDPPFRPRPPGSISSAGSQYNEMLPMMHSLMHSLLSKEVLYPALKDIINKYPEWLAENRLKLEATEYQKYSDQYDFMKQICEEFDTDCDSTEEAQTKQFEKVLELMQKMQERGNPPKEVMGPLHSELPLDEHGNLKLDGFPEPCSIM